MFGCALGADVTVEAFNLQVSPSPAEEGDLVSFIFHLTVISDGTVTLTAEIDDEEYATLNVSSVFSDMVSWEIADAGVLIDEFGLGDHTARVRVRISGTDRTAHTEQVTFTLIEAVP